MRGEISPFDYNAHPAVRWSLLQHMRKSPKHYKHALSNASADTRARSRGSAVHTLVFEPDTYPDRFVTYDAPKSKGEGSRKAWQAFQEDASARGLCILDPEDAERAIGCAVSIRTNSKAAEYLAAGQGRAEIPITWQDPDTGLQCKARLDYLRKDRLLLDLKSSRSTDDRQFSAMAWKYGYFHQHIFYAMGVAASVGCDIEEVPFVFLVVESEPPYDVAIFEPCPESRQAAHEDVKRLLAQLAECTARNHWPGRYEGVRVLSAPRYVLMDEDDEWQITTTEA